MASSIWNDLEEVKVNNNVTSTIQGKSVWDDLEEVENPSKNTQPSQNSNELWGGGNIPQPTFEEEHPILNKAKNFVTNTIIPETKETIQNVGNGLVDGLTQTGQALQEIKPYQQIEQNSQPIQQPTTTLVMHGASVAPMINLSLGKEPINNAEFTLPNNPNELLSQRGTPQFNLSATKNVLTDPAIQQLNGAEKKEFATRAITEIVKNKIAPQTQNDDLYNQSLESNIEQDVFDSQSLAEKKYYLDKGLNLLEEQPKTYDLLPHTLIPVTDTFSGVGQVLANVLPSLMSGNYNHDLKGLVRDVKEQFKYGFGLTDKMRKGKNFNEYKFVDMTMDIASILAIIEATGGKALEPMLKIYGADKWTSLLKAYATGQIYGTLDSLKEKGITKDLLADGSRTGAEFVAFDGALKMVGKLADKWLPVVAQRLNPANYEQVIKSVPKERGMGLSRRTVYEPKVSYEYKATQNLGKDINPIENVGDNTKGQIGSKNNELQVWKPNYELGEGSTLNASAVINQGANNIPLLQQKNTKFKQPLESSDKIVNNETKRGTNGQETATTRTSETLGRKNASSENNGRSDDASRRGNNSRLESERRRDERGRNGQLTDEHKVVVEQEYKNQHELNKAIEGFITNKEYEKYSELPEELKTWLKKFTGAGGLEKQGAEGKGLLSEYYTPENIVKKMWELTAQHVDTNNANVLESSAGIGRFLEFAPQNTNFDAVEMNPISAKITELLYPNANVRVGEFQEQFIDKSKNLPIKHVEPKYDIVIGNPPYGQYSGRYKGLGEGKKHSRLESYFINRGLDTLKENGIMTYIVPSSFLDGVNTPGKQEISAKCELLDAYRLPENTFDTTSIGTDIIVLRKTTGKGSEGNLRLGKWFDEHPEKILGKVEQRKNRFGKIENYVKGDKNVVNNIDTSKKNIKETIQNEEITKDTNHSKKKVSTSNKKIKKATEKIKKGNIEYKEYQAKNPVSEDDYKYFADTRVDGTLPQNKYTVGAKVNQYNGELFNDFNYLQGDIYEKLDALKNENISAEQKELQKKKLLSVLPKAKRLEEIRLTPTSDFVREFPMKITVTDYMGREVEESTSLDKKYLKYVRSLTNSERNGINVWDIEKFVNGDKIILRSRGTKEEKDNKRAEYLTKLKQTVDKTFNDFINSELSDKDRSRFVDNWNRTFNGIYTPDYTKMPMIVKNLNSEFYGKKLELQNVQIEGINYLTNKGVGLLGFEVGVGKTLAGIISTVQNMQMGRCKRPLILVPKQVKPNWIKEINESFPNMRINDLDNLANFNGQIEDGTISVATFQALDNLWYSKETLNNLLYQTYSIKNDFSRESTKRGKEKTSERIEQFIGTAEKGNKKKFNLEDLGIDHITVDEAHNFKNLFGDAKADGQQGNTYIKITGAESTRAKRLFLATQYILNNNNNRNIFMLTATPFNNSPLEVFNMLSYLAKDKLDKMGLYNVYQFMENYVDISADWVIDSKNDVVFKQIASGFKNLQSLQSIIKSCMLIRSAEDAGIKRPNKHTKRVVLEPTQEQLDIIAQAEEEAIKAKRGDKGAILKAISKSRIATISPDIYNKNLEISPEEFIKKSPKLEYVMNAVKSMKKSDSKTSQLVYMPIGVDFLPKIKQYLVNKGVYKANEIAIIKSKVNDDKISEIVDSFNDEDGALKLIIGTNKMKEGMNLNKNSSVLYVPYMDWNPTDYMQIVGRIWRRGNKYNDIRVVVPLLKDSSDPFMFQKLDEKTKRINNIMDTDKDYIDTSELSTAEEKINMITNPNKKANMFSQIERQKLDNQHSDLLGRLETTQHYKNALSQAKKDIENNEYWSKYYNDKLADIEDKESYQYSIAQSSRDSYKKELSKAKQNLKYLENKITKLELDFEGKDSEENIQKELEKITNKIANLKEQTEIKREEYQREYDATRNKEKAIDELIKDFENDTNSLYGELVENSSIDIPDFMKDNQSANENDLDIDLKPIYNALENGIKGEEFIKLLPKELADTMQNVSLYKFVKMENGNTKLLLNGQHNRVLKQITLNIDAIGNNPNKFITTLMHEVQHANQEILYRKIKQKPAKKWTLEERVYVAHYNICKRVNIKRQKFYNKHKSLIDKYDKSNFNSKTERFNKIKNLSLSKRKIIDEYDKILLEYFNAQFEIEARLKGAEYAKGYTKKSKYRGSRALGTQLKNMGDNGKWSLGTDSRDSISEEQFSAEQPKYKTREIKTDDIQKTTKNHIRKWYGGIEKDRYDVNKNLTSFINISKHYAKELSKKTGQKVTDKMVREIMPFLRERTEFPNKLNRPELKRLFDSLSTQDKSKIRSLADNVSDKFQKYYENYNYARGVVPEETIENHISHIWDLDKKKTSLLTNYFTTQSRFGKERIIETLIKGIDGFEVDGETITLKPKTLDYAEILKVSSDSLIKATHDIILAENVKNLTNGKEKLILPQNKAPKDYIEINHPALSKCVYRGGNEDITILERTPVAVHPDIADTLLTVFERQKPDNAFWKAYDSIGATMKYGELSLSGFHGFALSESSIGNVGLRKTLQHLNPLEIVDGIKNGNYYIYKNEKLAKDAIEHGLSLGTPLDIQRSTIEKIKVVGKVAEINNKILWDHLHSTYKLIAYDVLNKQALEKGSLTDEIKNENAQWVNDSFGGQVWQLLGVKPSQVKFAHRLMLSPDWFISTTRQATGALSSEALYKLIDKTQCKRAKDAARIFGFIGDAQQGSGMRGKSGRKFWLQALGTMLTMYNILNACFREKDKKEHPEHYGAMTPWDYSIWGNADKTDDMSLRMMPYIFIGRNSDGTARYLRLGKQFREVPELLAKPVEKVSPKLNPLINTGSKVLSGRDIANNIKYINGEDSFLDQDIWNGYGNYAVKKQGKDLAIGRAKVLGKSFAPYIMQNAINEKHNNSAWDFVAQTSNGLSPYKTKNKYETAFERGYRKDDIDAITKRAYKDGLSTKQIVDAQKFATSSLRTKYTNQYRNRIEKAIEKNSSNEIYNIRRDMTKHHIPEEEQRKIYDRVYKNYIKKLNKE